MGPLSTIKVVEFAGVGPVPLAGMLLADLGAQVIRVDRLTPSNLGISFDDRFDVNARGRRSIALDLSTESGADIARRLIDRADVLIEGFRPGVMERLGLAPEAAIERNPGLVYSRLTGFGQTGPLALRAGHDLNYIALSGALEAIGTSAKPYPPLNLVGDYAGGSLYMVVGVLAALVERGVSGQGQIIDGSIVDGALSLMSVFFGLSASGVWDRPRGENFLDGGAPFYDCYETADGRFMAVAPIEPKFFKLLIEALGLDADLVQRQLDRSAWPEIRARLTERFRQKSQSEWTALLEGIDCCVTPVLSVAEAADHPHVRARAAVIERDGLLQPAPAPRFSRTDAGVPGGIVSVGADTMAILQELGIDADGVRELTKSKAISPASPPRLD